MNPLNYNITSIRIAYRCNLQSIKDNGELERFWTPWRIYSRECGVMKPNLVGIEYLKARVMRLSKRHANREYKLIEVHEVRHVLDFNE